MTVKVIAAVLVVLIAFGAGVYVGRLAPQLADAKAIIKNDAQNQKQESSDVQRINQEAVAFHDASLDPIPAPVVRVQYLAPTACVPGAPAARPSAPSAPLPGGHPPDPLPPPGPVDIGEPLVRIGHDADAQVDQLLDYIDTVCLKKRP